jgi:dUTP pyrophosphatase
VKPVIKIYRMHHSAKIPAYKTKEAAGMDLHACLPGDSLPEDFRLESRGRLLIPTGFAIQIPPGYEGQIRPRSGLALEHGVTVLNAPGTLDSDYRGEVGVLLINHGQDDFWVKHGDRIAQLVIAKVERTDVLEVAELDETERGAGGFGSTGKS